MRDAILAVRSQRAYNHRQPLTSHVLVAGPLAGPLAGLGPGVLCARRQTDSVRYPRSRWATECICAALRGALHMYREGHVNGAAEGRLRKGRRGDADNNAWKTERAWACVEKSGGY